MIPPSILPTEPSALVFYVRQKYNLTQEQLAQKLQVSCSTVNRWENSHCRPHRICLNLLQSLAQKGDINE